MRTNYNRLRSLRKEKHLKQNYLANLLHVSQRAYSHYENGSRQIPIDILIRLARIYTVSTDYLLGLTDIRQPYPPPDPVRTSPPQQLSPAARTDGRRSAAF